MDKPIGDYQLGVDHEELILSSLDDNIAAVDALVGQARRKLQLLTRDLEPRLYDREPFYQALRQLAISNRNVEIQILVMDSDRVVKEGHRLINLGRRLSTFIQFRRVADDYQSTPSSFLIVDERGYLYRNLAIQYRGIADFNSPYRAQEYMRHFDEIWQHSSADPNLRQLHV